MINIEAKLTGDLAGDLDRFAKNIQDKVVLAGVAAMAKVIYDEVKLNTSGARAHGGRPLDPPDSVTGTLHNAIYRVFSPEQSTDEVKVYKVSVNKSKAPHWHLVEFGHWQPYAVVKMPDGNIVTLKNRPLDQPVFVPAVPYIRPTFDATSAQAIEAMKVRYAEALRETKTGWQ